jgi:hypothetical protein
VAFVRTQVAKQDLFPAVWSAGTASDLDAIARVAHGTQNAQLSFETKDRIWRRGWDSNCVHLLKTKNLADFHFLQIR